MYHVFVILVNAYKFLLKGRQGFRILTSFGRWEPNFVILGRMTLRMLLLMLPLAAVLIGREKVLPLLEKGKQVLFARGELVVSGVSLALGGYLGWQGISGLMLT